MGPRKRQIDAKTEVRIFSLFLWPHDCKRVMLTIMTTNALLEIFTMLLLLGVVVSAFRAISNSKVVGGSRLWVDRVNLFRMFAFLTVHFAVRTAGDAHAGRMFSTVTGVIVSGCSLLALMKMHAEAVKGKGSELGDGGSAGTSPEGPQNT